MSFIFFLRKRQKTKEPVQNEQVLLLELVMRIELMNLFITNEVLYRLSYTSTAHLLYLKIQ